MKRPSFLPTRPARPSEDLFVIGDWLVKQCVGGRVPDSTYKDVADQTGWSEQTLCNAKYVCATLRAGMRHPDLSMSHALEIVCRCPPRQRRRWVHLAVHASLSVRHLRLLLRREAA